ASGWCSPPTRWTRGDSPGRRESTPRRAGTRAVVQTSEDRRRCEDVAVAIEDPLVITRSVRIPLAEIELRASRSSGPGGQHANVTASRIEAVFDVAASSSLTPEQKARLQSRC